MKEDEKKMTVKVIKISIIIFLISTFLFVESGRPSVQGLSGLISLISGFLVMFCAIKLAWS